MKPHLAIVALAMLLLAGAAIAQSAFRFEDYREKTAYIAAVHQRFPVGSSYLAFKRIVIPAGAKAKRDMVDNEDTGAHTFIKQQRPTTGINFISTWSIAVTEVNDVITAITPTYTLGSSISVED